MGGKKKTNASKAAKTAARRGRYAPEGGGTLRKGRKRMDAVLAGLPSRKRRLLVSAGAAATLALIALIILFSVRACGARGPSGDLVLSISLSDPDAAALGTVLGRFRSLYPEISVSMRNTDSPSADAADVLIGPAHAFSAITEDSPVPPPVPWSGPVWVLAARSEILDSAAKSLPDQVAALRADRASPSDFKAVLQAVAELGVAPITLGNSHRWPYLLWIQHWAAATAGPAAANRIPPPNDGSDADLYAALRPAFSELAEWRGSGWFEPSAWNEGWAKGLLPLASGGAAFALVSAEYLSPIPEARRGELEFLPFPRRPDDAPWSIGSATFLGALPGTAKLEAAQILVRFLSSPGVTEELTRASGKPFFSWNAKSGEFPLVLPAWLEAAATEDFDALAREALR